MKYWIITDTHFGHRKMEEYCKRPSDFEARIFKGLKMIQPDDIVIHLGDFCIGDDVKWHDLWNSALYANKRILIRGNHDRKSSAWYYAHGWHAVCENLSLHYNKRYITFSHIPLENPQNLNIHGHLHANNNNFRYENEPELNKNHKLLAIELTDYKPVLLDKLIN